MLSMRRFFCAWMHLKAGHTIQILCVGADRCVPRVHLLPLNMR